MNDTQATVSSLKGETTIEQPHRSARAVARRAAEIRATVPDLELAVDVDARAIAAARAAGHSPTAVLVAACAGALRALPWANAAYRDERFERYGRVNVAVTVPTEDGLVAPVVLDADAKSLPQLTDELTRLAERVARGELTPPEQAGATFTLSDFSALPAHRWSPVITSPQAGALTAGAIRDAPLVDDGAVVAGSLITLTLACDHRILFGRRAAALLDAIAARVRDPAR